MDLLYVVIAGGVIALLAHLFSNQARLKRAVRNARLVTTQSFEVNTVGKVHGIVRYLGEPLEAPLSGCTCAYYEVIVEEYADDGESTSWRELLRERQGQAFLLEDSKGVARVSLHGAMVTLIGNRHYISASSSGARPELEALLARHGKSDKGTKLRYKEGVLQAGQAATVVGFGMHEPNPDPSAATGGYRDMAMQLVLSSSEHGPLYITDDPAALK